MHIGRHTKLMSFSAANWWLPLLGLALGLLLLWAALIAALWLGRPERPALQEALRLLPDVLRLLRRLGSDPALPRKTRMGIWLLLAYLALPIDLVPDFIPVLGYADDAIIATLALRAITRSAGPQALARHWPGTADGLAALRRLIRS